MEMTKEQAIRQAREKLGIARTFRILRPKVMRKYTEIYNSLCPDCRMKVYSNPQTKFEDYCQACQDKAKPILEDIQKMLG